MTRVQFPMHSLPQPTPLRAPSLDEHVLSQPRHSPATLFYFDSGYIIRTIRSVTICVR